MISLKQHKLFVSKTKDHALNKWLYLHMDVRLLNSLKTQKKFNSWEKKKKKIKYNRFLKG